MLTEQQKTLMNEILSSDNQVTNDRTQINALAGVEIVDNIEFKVKDNPESEGYKQTVTVLQPIKEPKTYSFYTNRIFTGTLEANFAESYAMLDAREQAEITDKMNELKNTII